MSRTGTLPRRWGRIGAYWLIAAALARLVLAAPPPAATSLTVDQLDQLLKQIRRQNDGRVARQITGIRLTERASAARIAEWEGELPGDRSRGALMVVADVAASLAPPAAETLTMPAPDAQAQQRMLARCSEYVNQTVPRLPNYFALRTTNSFEFTTAQKLQSQGSVNGISQTRQGPRVRYLALGPAKSSDAPENQYFLLESYAQEVTYRGDAEVVNAPPGANGPSRASPDGLTTSGEFGSVLELIVVDFKQDQMTWDHWEQGRSAQGSMLPLAVFHYSVSSERSHYGVNYPNELPENPAYHGEVAIDPESGAVRRITIFASSSESGIFNESSHLVEFAPTEIAGTTYICPVHSVAIVRFFDAFEYGNVARTPIPSQISINDVAFTKHHLFRSESHILSGASKP